MTTETFLGAEGTAREDHITHNAISTVRDGSNDLAMQLRVKDVGKIEAAQKFGAVDMRARHAEGSKSVVMRRTCRRKCILNVLYKLFVGRISATYAHEWNFRYSYLK